VNLKSTILLIGLASGLTVFVSAQGADWKSPPRANFPIVGGDLGNLRYSALTRINKSNVGRLGGAWMIKAEEGRGGWMQATPVVVDGIMYMSTGHIWARDARTGELKWRFPSGDISAGGGMSGGPSSHFNRGVVVAEGKVFSAGTGNTLLALDQKTGAVIWRTELAARGFANAPAIYHDGLVYMGVGGGEQGVRGQFGAYDAKTGKEVWKFYTIPGPGEFGHETWEGDSWKYGGAPVWTHPAIDPALGTIYIATGNAAPNTDGTKRAGDNLFAASIVALDLKTGKRKWHFQEVRHDIWDYDSPAAPVLADITHQGRARKVLIHAGKTGMMFVLDRADGKPVIPVEDRPVPQEPRQKTAATQPFSVGDSFVPTCPDPGVVPADYKSGCVFTPFYDEPVAIAPGTAGGLSWAPMSYSPQSKYVYVCGSVMISAFQFREQNFNEATGRVSAAPGAGRGFFRPPFPQTMYGTLTAMDPTTNKIVWQKKLPFMCGHGSGFLTTASGLLFHGQSDGNLVARDAVSGDVLWSFQTGAGADAPVVTYEVGGEQYVAILAGGNQFINSERGDNLWAFKVGGTLPPLPAIRMPGAPATPAPAAPKK
jgi:quinohemoprotein ethanol dehydrogenase